MALLFPWATKEYLLWEMSLGQIILYHNIGIELKYGKRQGGGKRSFGRDSSPAEIRKARDEARRLLMQGKVKADQERSDARKETYRAKYGDV